jgi:ArsR family transcriptional regulator, arsenate/arsenite/antimonite-responsive transcriptional repressor
MATLVEPRLPVLSDEAFAACCNPVTGGVVDTDAAEALARIFRALGDPTRVRLLSLIAAHADSEACVCDLTEPVGLSQPTVSHHLKQLVEAGLITREQRGKWAYYRVEQGALDALASALRRPAS